jgi:hypothetical protein
LLEYIKLKNYIENKMVMQHIYQPVMLKTLPQSKGYSASVEEIARHFLSALGNDVNLVADTTSTTYPLSLLSRISHALQNLVRDLYR